MRRRILSGLAATGLLVAQQAAAQQQCESITDQSVFELQALKSELMVLATSCHTDTQYNAFVNRYQADLAANERAFDDYFKRRYGKQGQREHDSYITSLANAQSDGGMRLGSDFCPRNAAIFNEVLGLRGPADLPHYAAGKDLVPVSLGACAAPPAPAHVTKARATKAAAGRTARKH
jgi:hypothetical protein